MVAEMLQKSKFLLCVLFSCYKKLYFICFIFMLYVLLYIYYIFMYILYVFQFCYTFQFSCYLILNLCDNVFIFIILYVKNCFNVIFLS